MSILGRVGRGDQIGGVDLQRLENGVRVARLRSLGGLDALVVVDRAMDIAQASFRGVPFVWHGPGGILPPHPGTMNDDDFARNFFGGLVTTCGLEAFGPSGHDEDGSWTMHGHVNHIAGEEISLRCDAESEDEFIELRGVVRQNRMFGETLRLERTWRMNRSGTLLRLHDRVTNEGGQTRPHMLLYHCNAGYPLLDERLRLSLTQSSMEPRDEQARKGLAVWDRGGAPQAGFAEEVFVHAPDAGADGWAVAEFRNDALPMTWTLRFRPEQLPACFSWRMLGARTYVMAIEPANCPTIQGRIEARKRGTLPMLTPGETREYDLEFAFELHPSTGSG